MGLSVVASDGDDGDGDEEDVLTMPETACLAIGFMSCTVPLLEAELLSTLLTRLLSPPGGVLLWVESGPDEAGFDDRSLFPLFSRLIALGVRESLERPFRVSTVWW